MKFTVPAITITALLMASPAFAQYGTGTGLDARRWRNEGRHVERSDASKETRGKPQAKETHGELQATPPCQGHEFESANDGLWQPISTGSKH